MISGRVNQDLEAVIRLRLHGSGNRERWIEATIDTGFNGSLTITPEIARDLELKLIARGTAVIANGTRQSFNICSATVSWDGEPLPVAVDVLNNAPLIGMDLLKGYELLIQVEEGGSVFIDAPDRS